MLNWISIKERYPSEQKDYIVFLQYSYPHIQNNTCHVAKYFPKQGVFAPLWLTTAVTHYAEIENLPTE